MSDETMTAPEIKTATRRRRVGVLTSGGDCPGLNTAIRALVLAAAKQGWEVVGFLNGYHGLLADGEVRFLTPADVRPIFHQGGTVLGTVNRGNPFSFPVEQDGRIVKVNRSAEITDNIERYGVDVLFIIGGDGSLRIARQIQDLGVPIVALPKTVDNDIPETDVSIGFDSAVTTASLNIDRLHTTAQSHQRSMVVEIMGRDAGWLALSSGLASGADCILIPEIPFDQDEVARYITLLHSARGHYSIVVVAEGAAPIGGNRLYQPAMREVEAARLGGMGQQVAEMIVNLTGQETRNTVLGYVQRGGDPTPFDRILASRLAVAAVDLAASGCTGFMVGVRGDRLTPVPLAAAGNGPRCVDLKGDLVQTAKRLGICFGEACAK